jgi:hypothetical protein
MSKVVVVPGLSRVKIERMAAQFIAQNQSDVLCDDNSINIEYIYEIVIPERFGIKTGYTDLSGLGPGIIGYTDAISMRSYVDSSLSDADDHPTRRRFRATLAHEAFHCIQHVPVLRYFRSISREEGDVLCRVEKKLVISPILAQDRREK